MVYKTKVKSNKRDQEEIMTISRPCKYYSADTQQLLIPHSLLEMVFSSYAIRQLMKIRTA